MGQQISRWAPLDRDQIHELVERFVDARSHLDVPAIRDVLDDNVLFEFIGSPAAIYPFKSRYFGRDEVVELVTAFKVNFECGGNEILKVTIEGDRAAVLRRAIFTHRATGRPCAVHASEWLRFRKGRIVEITFLGDNEAMRKALDEG
jgi:ketosteroid isomerase-like protein